MQGRRSLYPMVTNWIKNLYRCSQSAKTVFHSRHSRSQNGHPTNNSSLRRILRIKWRRVLHLVYLLCFETSTEHLLIVVEVNFFLWSMKNRFTNKFSCFRGHRRDGRRRRIWRRPREFDLNFSKPATELLIHEYS